MPKADSAPLRIAFAGTPEFAAVALESLINSIQFTPIVVYTQPDRPAGRGRKIQQSPVKRLALAHKLPVLQPASLRGDTTLAEMERLNLDLMIVVAYGQILPKLILNSPRLGCINVHASLLPRWRGAAPIQRAIAAGDRRSGVSIMQMEEGLDTGPVLLCSSCNIEPNDTAQILHDRLARVGATCLLDSLTLITTAQTKLEVQDDSKATYAEKISKQEAKINWQESTELIQRKIRAFNPVPVAHTQLFEQNVRIWEAEICKSSRTKDDLNAGQISSVTRDGIDVVTGDGILRILSLQLPGKRRVSAADFFNGNPNLVNTQPPG